MFEIGAADAAKCLYDDIYDGLVPFIVGSPGVGKSDIVKQICEENDFELIDLRLSQLEPVDLNGFPHVENGRMTYLPMDNIPLADMDSLPEGKKGWILFLDEFNSASLEVQKTGYKLILDRMVGKHKLHPNVRIICAGNKDTDKAITVRQSTAMQSRISHYTLQVSSADWLDWANANDIDQRVISFIKFKPDMLHKFNPNSVDSTFACP